MYKKVFILLSLVTLIIKSNVIAQLDTTQLAIHPRPIIDEINYTCGSGTVQVLIHAPVEGYTFGVIAVTPTTISVPPSNDSGIFNLTGTTAAEFIITTPQGCSLDTLVEFDCNNPLPIDLISFDAVLYERHKGLISWEVNEKLLVRSYELFESTDASNFVSLGEVPSVHSDGIANYQMIDEQLKKGNNYYKLRIDHYDGTSVWSPVRLIYYDENADINFTLYPNPTSGIIYGTLNAEYDDELQVSIYDALSRQVMPLETFTIQKGYNKVMIDMSRLANATYILHYEMAKNKLSGNVKVVKKN